METKKIKPIIAILTNRALKVQDQNKLLANINSKTNVEVLKVWKNSFYRQVFKI